MKLSKRTEYGVRAMVRLAARSPGEHVRMHELAAEEGLPARFLSAIMTRLRRHKFVASKPGADGGYWLARSPRDILVLNLVGCLEGGFAFRTPPRRSSGSETVELVHDLERRVSRQMTLALDGLTLAELARLAAARRVEAGPPTYEI